MSAMQKFIDNQLLKLPIEIRIFKRQYYWFMGMIILLTLIFGGFFCFYIPKV